jgi:predicted RNA-binding Zn ribbon-like protein
MSTMNFTFVSGHPSLDLAGTVSSRDGPDRYDLLDEPAALGRWLVEAGLLDAAPPVDAEGLARAAVLREVIYRLAKAHLDGTRPDPADRDTVNQTAQPAPVTVRLREDGGIARTGDLSAACATLARSAVELLGGPVASQLKACRGNACTRLFLDSSRRGTRQWCDMAGCGNRAKAAAFRRRHAPR